ncbi:hypothetical protein BM533_02030 [Clostridioides difficile]|nr:YIP1 family protein [Clostridioides difficile]OJT77466.1 hypothetical protein BM529_05405 [Clostridioides difficile]OJT80227.1 hypothetical protein BM531_03950 [Clostridioides difficile]OJT83276.1 hypothetical protein BM532_06895 [Clostridioides difficile]OJT90600.1 hypothetical protein BM533_02030 [Clostridioides difficile]
MKTFIKVLNNPVNTFKEKHISLSVALLSLTVFIVAILDPILRLLVNSISIDFIQMVKITLFGYVGYGCYCVGMYLICRLFGSKEKLSCYFTQWALSMTPTAICALVVTIMENYYYVFWNNSTWGLLLNFVFGGILIWKTILYIIFLRNVSNLKSKRLVGAMILNVIFILALSAVMGYMGLKTPII